MNCSPFSNPLVVALDVDSRARALALVDDLDDIAGGFKIGPRLIHRFGAGIVSVIANKAPVFVDCKHFDIPSTMEAAVRSSFESGASAVTVHLLSGREALETMAELQTELSKERPFRIFGVSVLTSWDQDSLPPSIKSQPISEIVRELVEFAQTCGLDSVVCSSAELSVLSDISVYKLVPGIRFDLQPAGDQKRISDPASAIKAGANALVVGRPIIEAPDPRQSALDFSLSIISRK